MPPPMSSFQLALPEQPVHVGMSPNEDALAVLFASGRVQVWDLGIRLPEAGASRLRAGGKVAEPKLRWEQLAAPQDEFIAKQVCLSGTGEAAALFWAAAGGDAVLRIANANDVRDESALLPCSQHILWDAEAGWLVADRDGHLHSVDEARPVAISLCPRPTAVAVAHGSGLVLALSDMGRLFAASLNGYSRDATAIATGVTSFTTTPEFLIYTTSAQSSHYAPLPSVVRVIEGEDVATVAEKEWEVRRVERGALAVVACPSSMSLVLQMPRGNLETVYPRPLVLSVVRRDILGCVVPKLFQLTRLQWRVPFRIAHLPQAPSRLEHSLRSCP